MALLPVGGGQYDLFDPRTMSRRRVDAALAETILTGAVMFYRPFNEQMTDLLALYRFALTPLKKDIGLLVLLAGAAALLGMLVPQATQMLIDEAIPDANKSLIIQMMLALLAVAGGQAMFELLVGTMMVRLQTSSTSSLQSAMWDRLLRLPMWFFKSFSSGDLMNRCMIVSEISQEISGTVLRTMISGGMSLINFAILFSYNSQLAGIAALIVFVLGVVTIALTRRIRQFALELEKASSRLFGFVVQLIYGIAKLRVSGSELRAYNQWERQYATQLQLVADMQKMQNVVLVFNFTLPVISSLILYNFATDIATQSVKAPGAAAVATLSMGTFLAFMSGFGTLLAGVTDLSKSIVDIMDSLGKARLIRPILDTKVEVTDAHNDPGRISGNVVLDDVSFRYREDGPLILNHITLRAEPGEFIAVVGQSGSGKSTLFRLMLGFEAPESGRVLYDNQDVASLDVTAVRRQIGVVLQSAKINSSSIFEFITSGSQMTLDEAWECAEGAGLADDIRAMPMGMHSVINEGGGSFSGGQRQRLMIARALATSALDNRTQQIVSESIRRRKVTRITIAHRLSTIRHADRIYVLDGGTVAQVGTFDELTSTPGLA